jgi:hypothetical protein
MKIRGPGSGTPTDSVEKSESVGKTENSTFAEKLEKTSGPTAATGPAPAARTAAQGKLTSDIARALKAKEITPEAAVDQVVSRILDRQVGAGGSPAARSQVETALRDALESDPVLAAKVKSLSS